MQFKKNKHKPLKQRARNNSKLDDKQFNTKRAKKMINPYYFTDGVLQVGFKITLESHQIIHANSKLIIKPNYREFRNEVRYNKKNHYKIICYLC